MFSEAAGQLDLTRHRCRAVDPAGASTSSRKLKQRNGWKAEASMVEILNASNEMKLQKCPDIWDRKTAIFSG
jgi:hypothetical protein